MAFNKPRLYYDNIGSRRDAAEAYIATVTAATTMTPGDYHAENVRDWRRFTRVRASNLTSPWWIKYDFLTAVSCTGSVLSGHNFGNDGLGAQIQWSTDDAAWNDIGAGAVFTGNGLWLQNFAAQSARYWRINVTGAMVEEPQVGIFFVGNYLELPHFLQANFNPLPMTARGQALQSVEGQILGVSVDYQKLRYNIVMDQVADSYVESTAVPGWQDFKDQCFIRRNPFFFAYDDNSHPHQAALVMIPPGQLYEVPYFKSLRQIRIKMDGKTEDFETAAF